MPTYQLKLKRQREVAQGTTAFFFEKPDGFTFQAGQFLRFTLINPPETDDEGNSRTFSIASAPGEPDLMIATRMRDTAFKRVVKQMAIGSVIEAKGPYGRMTLHEDVTRPAVFLTGGIGITPFRSIATDAAQNLAPHKIYLFYSNRRLEDAAFLSELAALEGLNPKYQFIATFTDLANSNIEWSGETGRIDVELLARFIEDLKQPVYYVAGPPGMVTAMRALLAEASVDEADIRIEEFSGY